MCFTGYWHIKGDHGVGSPFLHNIVNVFCLETAALKVTNALCPHFAKSVLDHNVPKFIKEGGHYMSHLLWMC